LLVRGASSVLAAGPTGLVRAAADAALQAGLPCQVALEAPMACGYGSCHGCAVTLDGRLVRLCLEGPVVDARRL
jgi:dihydroorotate dehydrogenase electron transfer subunit